MTLEDIVPPLELCKRITPGNFDNSALAWFVPADTDFPEYGDPSIIIRNYAWAATSERGIYPAPTLAEILKELIAYDEDAHLLWCIADFPEDGEIRVCGEAWRVGYSLSDSQLDRNPATAALKLWMSVMSDKSEKSVETP